MSKYLSCAETAKIVRQALKEAFPGIKFSVRSSTYSGGASMRVRWTDGPNNAQVEAITDGFNGAYFDGMIDYKGSVYHMMNGEQVRFGSDFIFCERDFSDAAVQRAIDRVYRKYQGNFTEGNIQKPTVEQYRNGKFWSVRLPHLHHYGNQDIQSDINEALYRHSDRMAVAESKTAKSVFVTHDDGYSRQAGAGISAVGLDAIATTYRHSIND